MARTQAAAAADKGGASPTNTRSDHCGCIIFYCNCGLSAFARVNLCISRTCSVNGGRLDSLRGLRAFILTTLAGSVGQLATGFHHQTREVVRLTGAYFGYSLARVALAVELKELEVSVWVQRL